METHFTSFQKLHEVKEHSQRSGKKPSKEVQCETIDLIPLGERPKRKSKEAIKVNLN